MIWHTCRYTCTEGQPENHRRRSGWTSGGTHGKRRRWVRVEWDGIWGGVSPLQPTKGSGERRELPQRGTGRSPGRKRILAYFEGHRTLIFVPIWQNLGGGQFALASPASNSGGRTCPPVPPVIYAHAENRMPYCFQCRSNGGGGTNPWRW